MVQRPVEIKYRDHPCEQQQRTIGGGDGRTLGQQENRMGRKARRAEYQPDGAHGWPRAQELYQFQNEGRGVAGPEAEAGNVLEERGHPRYSSNLSYNLTPKPVHRSPRSVV